MNNEPDEFSQLRRVAAKHGVPLSSKYDAPPSQAANGESAPVPETAAPPATDPDLEAAIEAARADYYASVNEPDPNEFERVVRQHFAPVVAKMRAKLTETQDQLASYKRMLEACEAGYYHVCAERDALVKAATKTE